MRGATIVVRLSDGSVAVCEVLLHMKGDEAVALANQITATAENPEEPVEEKAE